MLFPHSRSCSPEHLTLLTHGLSSTLDMSQPAVFSRSCTETLGVFPCRPAPREALWALAGPPYSLLHCSCQHLLPHPFQSLRPVSSLLSEYYPPRTAWPAVTSLACPLQALSLVQLFAHRHRSPSPKTFGLYLLIYQSFPNTVKVQPSVFLPLVNDDLLNAFLFLSFYFPIPTVVLWASLVAQR